MDTLTSSDKPESVLDNFLDNVTVCPPVVLPSAPVSEHCSSDLNSLGSCLLLQEAAATSTGLCHEDMSQSCLQCLTLGDGRRSMFVGIEVFTNSLSIPDIEYN